MSPTEKGYCRKAARDSKCSLWGSRMPKEAHERPVVTVAAAQLVRQTANLNALLTRTAGLTLLHRLACISLPLIISIVDVKVSASPGPKVDLLHDLYESVTAYQPQLDTVDWVSDALRKILEQAGVERVCPVSDVHSAIDDPAGSHPSFFLRMAMATSPQTGRGSFPGENNLTDISLSRLMEPAVMGQIKLILSTNTDARHIQSARSAASDEHTPSDHDRTTQQRIAAWSTQDQALSAALGMVSSPSLATVESRASHESAAAHSADHIESTAAARELADRAFSALGDNRETKLLAAFAFKDQAPRASVVADQFEWITQEQEQRTDHVGVDVVGKANGTLPLNVQSTANLDVSRLDFLDRFWSEGSQHL